MSKRHSRSKHLGGAHPQRQASSRAKEQPRATSLQQRNGDARAESHRSPATDIPATHGNAATPSPRLRDLGVVALLVEICLLALLTVAPLGGVAQSISPLARTWPWLLAPARVVFGSPLVAASVPPQQGWPALALFVTLLVAASCAAALAVPLCRRQPASNRRHLALALGAALILGVTLALLPSLPSDDIFSYILYGRIRVAHHANPLIVTPSTFPHDPFLTLVFWRGVRSVYGPVWLLISAGLTQLAQLFGGSLSAYVALFKLLGLVAHLANATLIWLILGRLAPQRRLLGTLLYAWNPLCLLEFCASAHNDAVMLTFALIGVYCLVRHWEWAAPIAFGLSISTKYVLLALLPAYLVFVFWQRRTHGETPQRAAFAAGWRLVVTFGVIALTAIPFWDGPQTFGAILYSPPAQQLDNSLLESLSWPLRALAQAVGLSRARAATLVENGLKLAALLVFALLWLRTLRRARTIEGMLVGWGWTLFWYVVIASGWFWPWYVTWVVALVALLPWSALTVASVTLSASALTLYAFLPLYAAPIYGLRAWLVFLPPILFLAWRTGRHEKNGDPPAALSGQEWWRRMRERIVFPREFRVHKLTEKHLPLGHFMQFGKSAKKGSQTP